MRVRGSARAPARPGTEAGARARAQAPHARGARGWPCAAARSIRGARACNHAASPPPWPRGAREVSGRRGCTPPWPRLGRRARGDRAGGPQAGEGLALMSRAAHRHKRLEACTRLHTHGALATARWSRVVARRHPSATKAATRFRHRCASATCNCAKLRARLRPSVRFLEASDTNCTKYGQNIGAAKPLEIGHLRNK
jgi:hypothetical protein